MGEQNRTPLERVMERTAVPVGGDSVECWHWTGAVNGAGYGVIRIGDRVDYVHRVVMRERGEQIDGLTVDHLCFNRLCVRPSHLWVCSRDENTRRAMSEAWRELARGLIDAQGQTAVAA